MNVFSTLGKNARLMIVLSTTSLLGLAIALLMFGHNALGHENELIQKAAHSTRADMLYSHPEGH